MNDDTSLIRKAYEQKNWRKLAELTDDKEMRGEIGAYKILCAFHNAYEDYLEDAAEQAEDAPKSIVAQIFAKKSPDELLRKFYDLVGKCAKELESILPGVRPDMADEFSGDMICALLRPKSPKEAAYWQLLACEHHTIPLLEFLALEKTLEIYVEYNETNPDNQSLPNQLRVKKALKEQITLKGGVIPKRKLW